MAVSPGGALVLSAALHALGFGVAGWATHARYREPALFPESNATRAYVLSYLTPAPPEVRPTPPRSPARPPTKSPKAPSRPAGGRAPVPVARAAAAPAAAAPGANRVGPRASVQVRELSPGTVTGISFVEPDPAPVAESAPRRVSRPAALLTRAGSACPSLPVRGDPWSAGAAVAVAVVVDTNGSVDRSALRVVESPGRAPADRSFYPRIYVVGAGAAPDARRLDPEAYAAFVVRAVASHVAGLMFQPALSDGRPVRSTVLVACQLGSRD